MPAWLKVVLIVLGTLPYLLLLAVIVGRRLMRSVAWTKEERDAILAELIKQRAEEKLFERMETDYWDSRANTRGEAN